MKYFYKTKCQELDYRDIECGLAAWLKLDRKRISVTTRSAITKASMEIVLQVRMDDSLIFTLEGDLVLSMKIEWWPEVSAVARSKLLGGG